MNQQHQLLFPSFASVRVNWFLGFFLAGSRSIFTFACRACRHCAHLPAHMTHDANNHISIRIQYYLCFFLHWTLNAQSQRSHLKWIPNNDRVLARFTRREIQSRYLEFEFVRPPGCCCRRCRRLPIIQRIHELLATQWFRPWYSMICEEHTRHYILRNLCASFHHQNVKCLHLVYQPAVHHDASWCFDSDTRDRSRLHVNDDDGRPHTQETHFDLSQFPCKMYSFEWRWRWQNWNRAQTFRFSLCHRALSPSAYSIWVGITAENDTTWIILYQVNTNVRSSTVCFPKSHVVIYFQCLSCLFALPRSSTRPSILESNETEAKPTDNEIKAPNKMQKCDGNLVWFSGLQLKNDYCLLGLRLGKAFCLCRCRNSILFFFAFISILFAITIKLVSYILRRQRGRERAYIFDFFRRDRDKDEKPMKKNLK